MPGFTAPKLLWIATHEPEIFAATKLVLLPKAYLRLVLSGEAIEDVSDASGSLWLDAARRDWSDDGTGSDRPVARSHAASGRGMRARDHAARRAGAALGHDQDSR